MIEYTGKDYRREIDTSKLEVGDKVVRITYGGFRTNLNQYQLRWSRGSENAMVSPTKGPSSALNRLTNPKFVPYYSNEHLEAAEHILFTKNYLACIRWVEGIKTDEDKKRFIEAIKPLLGEQK